MSRDDDREVIYVERESQSLFGPLLVGLAVGVGLGLLFAPHTGEETRRRLRRRIRQARAMAEEKVDEISTQFRSPRSGELRPPVAGGGGEAPRPPALSAREELERRLAEARARRRAGASATAPDSDDEEPVA